MRALSFNRLPDPYYLEKFPAKSDSLLEDAEDPQFHALTGSEIVSLKEVRKSYCGGARPRPGGPGQSEAVKRNACKELQLLALYLMSAPEVSGGAVRFSAMVDEQCRH
ncbi:MAG: hypothetical protein ACREUD_02780 [Gammaproteobacteria bacterium]